MATFHDFFQNKTLADPNIIATILENIRIGNNGELRAQDILEYARNNTQSPIHDMFEWDDKIAAEEHRLTQAKTIIRAVYIEEEINEKPTIIRAYISKQDVGEKEPGTFITIQAAMEDPIRRGRIIESALLDLKRFTAKYEKYDAFSQCIIAVNTAISCMENENAQ